MAIAEGSFSLPVDAAGSSAGRRKFGRGVRQGIRHRLPRKQLSCFVSTSKGADKLAAVWRGGCSLPDRRTVKEAVILKISIFEWTRETRFLLEGKLAHEWVLEAEKAWGEVERARNGKHLVVDLCAVSFVDRAGEHLLERVAAAGAILIGADPMMRSLIEEIKARVAQRGTAQRPASLVLVLFLSALLGTLIIGCSFVL